MDSSVSSLPRPGSSVETVSLSWVCVAATHRATGTGGGRRLQAMVVSTSLVTELCGSLLDWSGARLRADLQGPMSSVSRLPLSAPLLASVQLHAFPWGSPPGQSPLQLRGSAHAVPPAWSGSWGHLLRPCSPGLGRAFLNHPPQRHPTHPLLLTSFVCFSLNFYLQSTYHFLTFYIFIFLFSSVFFPH